VGLAATAATAMLGTGAIVRRNTGHGNEKSVHAAELLLI